MEPMELLKKIVSIHSVFPQERELAHFLAARLERCGFVVQMHEFETGRYNVLASRGTRGKPILLYAHMDTVPAYGYEATGQDPLRLEERDGRLYGLGVYDMKTGLAAILKTMEEVRTDRTIKILFASDEEADSRGCYAAAQTGFLQGVEFALSTELSDVHDPGERTRTITLGRRGRVQYEIEVPGRSFHAAKMERGISAVTEASKLAIELERMNAELPRHAHLSHGNQYVRRFFSESVSLSLPDTATLWVDRHLVPPESAESARQQIEQKIDSLYRNGILRETDGRRARVQIRPREVPYMMPYEVRSDNPQVQRLSTVIQQTLNVPARYNYGLTVADENMIAMQGIPVVCYGPIGDGEHSGGEWILKKSYLEMIEVLKNYLTG